MIKLKLWNTSHKSISPEKVQNLVKLLNKKRDSLGFIDVDMNTQVDAIQEYVHCVWNDFESIVVLWIWGSALGTKALLESLYGKYYNEIRNKQGKNIYVLDNVDSYSIADLEDIIDISKTLFIFISKSGSTIETLSEYLYFQKVCEWVNPDWKKQFCFVIGENCSMKENLKKDFQCFYIPENIWGRFSVFTAVGLLPIAFSGVDIHLILKGVSKNKQRFLSENLEENTALKLALLQHYYYYNKQKNICVFFPYSSRLFQVWEWYKQLMGESIWKNGKWITLTSALGATDQHSQLQLFQDGPQDKFFVTVYIRESEYDFNIHNELSFTKLIDIERYGTETSLKHEWHPLCSLSLKKLNEKHIAELLYLFMFQIAYLGELFDIDAFDQPGVEKSKIITRKKLISEFWDIDLFSEAFGKK